MFKKLLKNKKGFVIETAILFMLAIFSMCFLLSTLTISGHNRAKLEKIKFENELNVDRIVEDYLSYISSVDVTKNGETDSPEQGGADPASLEISGEYPIVSLLENAENPPEPATPVYESFADYIEEKADKDKEIYDAYIFESIETVGEGSGDFTLTVKLKNANVQVLKMHVSKSYTDNQTNTTIDYIRKVPITIG